MMDLSNMGNELENDISSEEIEEERAKVEELFEAVQKLEKTKAFKTLFDYYTKDTVEMNLMSIALYPQERARIMEDIISSKKFKLFIEQIKENYKANKEGE